jgi:hypothetical protein
MARTVATDPQLKAEALRLADEKGVAQAARETGIPAGTIRAWRSRTGAAGPPPGVDRGEWVAKKEEAAARAWETAMLGEAAYRRLLAAGKSHQAQQVAMSFGIFIDKSSVLQKAAEAEKDRHRELSEAEGDFIVALLTTVLSAFEVDLGAVSAVVGERLGGDMTQGAAAVPPLSAEERERVQEGLRTSLRASLKYDLRGEVRTELRDEMEPEIRQEMRKAMERWLARKEHDLRGAPGGATEADIREAMRQARTDTLPGQIYRPKARRQLPAGPSEVVEDADTSEVEVVQGEVVMAAAVVPVRQRREPAPRPWVEFKPAGNPYGSSEFS